MIIVINKYVESWKSWKLFRGERKLRGWKKARLTWKMDDIYEETVAEVEFFQHYLLQIKILTYLPWLVSFDLDPWKFIEGLRYNPNSMCLSILHFFHFIISWIELNNINMILKELHKTNASKGSKRWSTMSVEK